MRLIFMGTTPFSAYTLEQIIKSKSAEVVAVYTQPPRPAGRGYDTQKTPVHIMAEAYNLKVLTPKTLRDDAVQKVFLDFKADVAVLVAYGLILPQEILDAPKMGCVNIHASLLPRWRGAAPIERAILAGDMETGITIIKMDKGLDTGPTLATHVIDIVQEMTRDDLALKMQVEGTALLLEMLPAYVRGAVHLVPQPEVGTCYAEKIQKSEAQLLWSESADQLARTVWAFTPKPGAWMMIENHRIKVLSATYDMVDRGYTPGTILNDQMHIACRVGVFKPTILQRSGGKPQPIDDFVRGFVVPKGRVLPCSVIN